MISAELTKKMERLSGDDYNIVVTLINRLLEKQEELQRLSSEQIVDEMAASIGKSDEGYTKSAREVSKEMRAKYALHG